MVRGCVLRKEGEVGWFRIGNTGVVVRFFEWLVNWSVEQCNHHAGAEVRVLVAPVDLLMIEICRVILYARKEVCWRLVLNLHVIDDAVSLLNFNVKNRLLDDDAVPEAERIFERDGCCRLESRVRAHCVDERKSEVLQVFGGKKITRKDVACGRDDFTRLVRGKVPGRLDEIRVSQRKGEFHMSLLVKNGSAYTMVIGANIQKWQKRLTIFAKKLKNSAFLFKFRAWSLFWIMKGLSTVQLTRCAGGRWATTRVRRERICLQPRGATSAVAVGGFARLAIIQIITGMCATSI